MDLPIPTSDGEVNDFAAVLPPNAVPRIYYVNGIQTDGKGHAQTATALSVLTEHVVTGVYNATAGKGAGIVLDLLQCGADWADVFLSKLAELGNSAVSRAVDSVVNFVRSKRGLPPREPTSVADAIR